MPATNDPFAGASPVEVPLPNAPLVRVLCQIKFPEILAVENKEFAAPFQEEIRSSYPVLRQEQGGTFILGPNGFTPKTETNWRFADSGDDWSWRVSLTPTFISLETKKYISRADFVGRLGVVVKAVAKHLSPSIVDRVGLRYIDRVEGASLEKLEAMVHPEVLGIMSSALGGSVLHSIQETGFKVKDHEVLLRSSFLPGGISIDPSVIEPVAHPSWLLDLDIIQSQTMPFQAESVIARVSEFAERGYALFRWAVKDEFLREYGGKI